jgi:hypothetical protein
MSRDGTFGKSGATQVDLLGILSAILIGGGVVQACSLVNADSTF